MESTAVEMVEETETVESQDDVAKALAAVGISNVVAPTQHVNRREQKRRERMERILADEALRPEPVGGEISLEDVEQWLRSTGAEAKPYIVGWNGRCFRVPKKEIWRLVRTTEEQSFAGGVDRTGNLILGAIG